jgi:hypothetical protein
MFQCEKEGDNLDMLTLPVSFKALGALRALPAEPGLALARIQNHLVCLVYSVNFVRK